MAGQTPASRRPKPAGAFVAGAASRLLPASVPLRFFGAATFFHLLAWLALFAGSGEASRFAGGLGWTLASLQTGSMVVDVWKDSQANFPPTVADTITGTEKPQISASNIGEDLSLSTWTGTSFTQGDWLVFNVDSATTIQQATLVLHMQR